MSALAPPSNGAAESADSRSSNDVTMTALAPPSNGAAKSADSRSSNDVTISALAPPSNGAAKSAESLPKLTTVEPDKATWAQASEGVPSSATVVAALSGSETVIDAGVVSEIKSLPNLALYDDSIVTVDTTDVGQCQQIIPTYVVGQMHCGMGQFSNSMLMVRKTGSAANGSEEPPTVLDNAGEAPRSTPQPTSDADVTLEPIDRHDQIQSQSGSSHEDRPQQHGNDDYVEINVSAELAAQLESGSNINSRDENKRRPLHQRLNRLRQSAEAAVNKVAPDDRPRTVSAKKSLKDFRILNGDANGCSDVS